MAAPETTPLTIVNATVPLAVMGSPNSGAVQKVDVVVERGLVTAIGPAGSLPPVEGQRIDADGGLLLPCFIDMHTHLDKGHIWPRRDNPDGTWIGALLSVGRDRESNWAAVDVERRMDFALRCAYANGTAAIRTHLDSAPPQHEITWDVFSRMRSKWAGRIELQGCSIVGPDTALDAAELDAVAKTAAAHNGILGGSVAVHVTAEIQVVALRIADLAEPGDFCGRQISRRYGIFTGIADLQHAASRLHRGARHRGLHRLL